MGRRAKNHIASVRIGEEIVMDQERKVEAFTEADFQLLGRVHPRENSIDLEELEIPTVDLQDLDDMFTEEEVWRVVKDLHPDRVPGLDGFIGAFYQRAWPIIKGDILAGLFKLSVGDGRGFARLNRALVTLIPKKQDATEVKDYRPISLVHSFAKLFSKIMANRLRRRLGEVVSTNQSAFVRGRSLHDNLILVRQVARKINQQRQSGVLLKLDLTRAFDSISWSFLFEVLRRMGFGERFLKWVSLLLNTANTRVLVNGVPGGRIVHGGPESPESSSPATYSSRSSPPIPTSPELAVTSIGVRVSCCVPRCPRFTSSRSLEPPPCATCPGRRISSPPATLRWPIAGGAATKRLAASPRTVPPPARLESLPKSAD
ncbi:hypothetical protein QYE76_012459 [Lolium multiflorum]|uniref:Reverse transcriptase domain-containing protein n=1 Tax=Lolium multiflorum TaxID=4521 RepID=A0AAD8X6B1_LOLMU|nr:hypothetical protein QYE76_012459 [Lolium multiflorum]